jgi:NitT/TauT family transport system permease protein
MIAVKADIRRLLAPAAFGAGILLAWQMIVVGFDIPRILLPAPTEIGHQLVAQAGMLWADFQQTFLKSVLAGFAMGCGLGFFVAVLTDRVPFLQRGLLPLGNMVSAVPIVGIAPIMVMWFGFGWESKAAVIVVMTFFPMLINTIAGLNASDHMERDLMRSYGSSYWQTFFMLRLPAALPFIFNALKINSTLALIGAIVAEMFGSPISGMGFRISTEVYKMNVDIVWATIAVAAVAGSAFYGLLALIERRLTFWHPSYRSKSYAR